jgi:hypothetical protein
MESTFGVLAKFDSQINSRGDLVWESGATPDRCTYSVHLSVLSKNLVGLGQSHLNTRPKPSSTHKLFQVGRSTRQLHHKQEELVD